MKITAIITCHKNNPQPIVNNLLSQTRPPNEILLGLSLCANIAHIKGVDRIITNDDWPKSDYGYAKRQDLAARASGTWLCFFSHDDSYHPRYLELMEKAAISDTDVVYCSWSDAPHCRWLPCDSTLGNFLVRKDVFDKASGFAFVPLGSKITSPDGRIFTVMDEGFRDAFFIQRTVQQGARAARVPYALYYHNVPYTSEIQATSWGGERKIAVTYEEAVAYTDRTMKQ